MPKVDGVTDLDEEEVLVEVDINEDDAEAKTEEDDVVESTTTSTLLSGDSVRAFEVATNVPANTFVEDYESMDELLVAHTAYLAERVTMQNATVAPQHGKETTVIELSEQEKQKKYEDGIREVSL